MSIKDRIIMFLMDVEVINVDKLTEIVENIDKDDDGMISIKELIQAIKG